MSGANPRSRREVAPTGPCVAPTNPAPSAPSRASPARGEPPCWRRVPRHSERGQFVGAHQHSEPEQPELRDRGGARTQPPEGRGHRLSRAGTQVLPAKMTSLAVPEASELWKKIEAVFMVVVNLSVLGNC